MVKVSCISATPQPKKVIAAGVLNMRGDMRHSLDDISDAEADEIFSEMQKTALNGVFEWITLVFQVDGVSRAFTHQAVRHRVGFSFSQESMRFTKVEDMDVICGPSVKTDEQKALWAETMDQVEDAYHRLIDAGVETQDARGILPTNVTTRIGIGTNYRALVGLAGDRLCLQAQGEWREVIRQMKEEVRRVWGDDFADYLVPVCFHEKRCKFESIFDRPCPIQERWK